MDINESLKHLIDKDDRVHVKPFIPKEKAINAISTYTDKIDPDEIILLIDETLTGSGKSGMVVTETAIYLREDFEKGLTYEFEYIPSLNGKKTLMGVDLYIGKNKSINIGMPSKEITLDVLKTVNNYIQYKRGKNNNCTDEVVTNELKSSNNDNVGGVSKAFSFARKIGSIVSNTVNEKSLEIDEKKRELNKLSDDELIRIVNSDSFFSRSTQDKSISFNILKSRGYSSEEIKKWEKQPFFKRLQ